MDIYLQDRRTFKALPRGRFLSVLNGNNQHFIFTWLWWTLQIKNIKNNSSFREGMT